MQTVNPTWSVINKIKFKIVTGHSVRNSILDSSKTLENALEHELFLWAQRFPAPFPEPDKLTPAQLTLVHLLDEGLRGKPIYEPLHQLEQDVRESLLAEIQEHVDKLPFLSLIPLLFFIGPSLFLILVGPLLSSLIRELTA